jgi:polysaccharide deacetylase family sporulation protein PdaB
MKVFIITKKRLTLCAFIFISMLIGTIIGAMVFVIPNAAGGEKKLPIYCVKTNEKKIALTFDAAWGNSDTDQLIKILKEHKAKATFFTTGDWVTRFPNDVKKLSKEGHDIQNHSDNHPHVKDIGPQKLIEDTTACDQKIKEITGKKPTLYRAPYGEYSNKMLNVFEKTLAHKVIQWDVDSVDWKGKSENEMFVSVTQKVKNGSIVLFHNDVKNTPQAVEQILDKLGKEGYSFVLVKDLIYTENYTIDHTGMQIKK